MKRCYLLLLALASCATPQTRTWPTRISPADSAQLEAYRRVFDGHPPVVVMDLEAAPDSIATVVAVAITDSLRKAAKK